MQEGKLIWIILKENNMVKKKSNIKWSLSRNLSWDYKNLFYLKKKVTAFQLKLLDAH